MPGMSGRFAFRCLKNTGLQCPSIGDLQMHALEAA
jgi:hypothetical protein